MPREFRRLTFSTHELAEAMTGYDRLARRLPRKSRIVRIDVVEAPAFGMRVGYTAGDAALLESVMLDAAEVGAALVLYCLDHGIPIPKGSTRTVVAGRGEVALCFYLNEEVRPGESVLPEFFDYDFFG